MPQLRANGSGVVDAVLRLLTDDNLYACDLAIFCTSQTANPPLTLVALAGQLTDHLAGSLGGWSPAVAGC